MFVNFSFLDSHKILHLHASQEHLQSMCQFEKRCSNGNGKNKKGNKKHKHTSSVNYKAGIYLQHKWMPSSILINLSKIQTYLKSNKYTFWVSPGKENDLYIILHNQQECDQFNSFINQFYLNYQYKNTKNKDICSTSIPWNTKKYKHSNIFLNENKNRPFITLKEYLKIKAIDFDN